MGFGPIPVKVRAKSVAQVAVLAQLAEAVGSGWLREGFDAMGVSCERRGTGVINGMRDVVQGMEVHAMRSSQHRQAAKNNG